MNLAWATEQALQDWRVARAKWGTNYMFAEGGKLRISYIGSCTRESIIAELDSDDILANDWQHWDGEL